MGAVPGRNPHGIALSRVAQTKQPGIRVIFTARKEMEEYTEGLGELIPHPVSIPDLIDAVGRFLDQDGPLRSSP